LTDCPSQSFTLRNLGSRLLPWLDSHAEFTAPHGDLALDMVRLEWAHIEAFDAAERQPLTPAQIAGLNGAAKLSLQPYIRLLKPHYAVDDILLALKASSRDVAALNSRLRANWLMRFGGLEEIFMAVHRAEFNVHYRRLEPGEFAVLAGLQRGLSLGDAIESALADRAGEGTDCPGKVQEWFGIWSKLGWLSLRSASRPRAASRSNFEKRAR
jgi:hypothetical protein